MKDLIKGWEKVKLGEVAKYINNKINTSELSENSYISTENMIVDRGGVTKASNIPKNTKANYFEKNDILFSNIRTYFKKLWKSHFNGGASNDVLIIRTLNSQKILNDFLYYVMSEEFFFDYTINTSKGTKMPRGDKEAIMKYEFLIPKNIETQQKIASILSSLDDKIEVNNEMNKTLEEMAQTLFKRWFIDFDFPNENGEPYKSSGGKMVESELGEIPEGWKVGVFREFTKETIGGDWGKEIPQGNYTEEVFCIRGTDIINSTKGNFEKVPRRFILNKNFQNKKLIFGDMIVEISGGSPTQSTGRIGYINKIILENLKKKLITTNFCRIMRPYNLEETAFIYNYWIFLYDMTIFFKFENGTTGIKNLALNEFLDSYTIVKPPSGKIKEYTQIVDKFNILIQENGKQTQSLTKIRDTLLPKLMSGEVEV